MSLEIHKINPHTNIQASLKINAFETFILNKQKM